MSEDLLGYLLLLGEPPADDGDADLITASYTATLFALTLARAGTRMELRGRYQGAIVDSLFSGHFLVGLDARRKVRAPGLADDRPYRVTVARQLRGASRPP